MCILEGPNELVRGSRMYPVAGETVNKLTRSLEIRLSSLTTLNLRLFECILITMADNREAKRRSHQRKPGDDYPYTMKLPDGRSVYVEVPGRWVTKDRGGEVAFLPQAVRFLDRVRALATPLNAIQSSPSPGFIATL